MILAAVVAVYVVGFVLTWRSFAYWAVDDLNMTRSDPLGEWAMFVFFTTLLAAIWPFALLVVGPAAAARRWFS